MFFTQQVVAFTSRVVVTLSYPSAVSGKTWDASDQLWESLCWNVWHFAERQQLIDDDKATVKEFGFNTVAIIVQKPWILYLHPSQVGLDHQPVTCNHKST